MLSSLTADIKEFLSKHIIPFHETEDFESILPQVDAIYMTRIQNEYGEGASSEAEIFPEFHLKKNICP
jgi:aspartate carbamoyltransferase catalytic subunit